ncbi:MAG: N4-gp56 family major capsid protein, partial [Gemmiger sp.]
MADIITKLADLIDPEVMADMISARIPAKIRVAPFAKVDDTLAGVPGDTITVPAYAYIGDAADVAEGAEVTIEKMTTST